MKSERGKDAKPYYGCGARRAAEMPRGAAKQKKPCKEEQNGGDTKILEASSGPA